MTRRPKYNPHTEAVKRSMYQKQLAWAWIKANREDIADLIQEEAVKRYPLARLWKRHAPKLPPSLRRAA